MALGILASLSFASSIIFARRGTMFASPIHGVLITVMVGPVFFICVLLIAGEFSRVPEFAWSGIAVFALAGVMHFAIGRSLNYSCIQILGASRATILTACSPLFTIPLAIGILGESLTWPIALGAPLVIIGPMVMMWGAEKTQPPALAHYAAGEGHMGRGLVFGLGAALFYGSSFVVVKVAVEAWGYPLAGAFVSYCAASLFLGTRLSHEVVRKQVRGMDPRGVAWYALSGISVSMAQALSYTALEEGDVTVVSLLLQMIPLFVLALSALVNRQLEALNGLVWLGSVLVVLGTAAIVVG